MNNEFLFEDLIKRTEDILQDSLEVVVKNVCKLNDNEIKGKCNRIRKPISLL